MKNAATPGCSKRPSASHEARHELWFWINSSPGSALWSNASIWFFWRNWLYLKQRTAWICVSRYHWKTASTAATAFLDPTVRVENRFGQSCEMLCPDRLAFDGSLGQTIGSDALTYCLQFLPFCKAGNRKSKRQSSQVSHLKVFSWSMFDFWNKRWIALQKDALFCQNWKQVWYGTFASVSMTASPVKIAEGKMKRERHIEDNTEKSEVPRINDCDENIWNKWNKCNDLKGYEMKQKESRWNDVKWYDTIWNEAKWIDMKR